MSALNSLFYTAIQEIKTPPNNLVEVNDLFERFNQPAGCEYVKWQQRYFQIERFKTALPTSNQPVWTFHAPKEHQLIEKLKQNAPGTLADISQKISVGLKTTADNVFIKPMTLDFINQLHLETAVVFPVLESHNISKWHCDWQEKRDLYVLYPYQYQNDRLLPIELNLYPNTKQYLLSHQKQH